MGQVFMVLMVAAYLFHIWIISHGPFYVGIELALI